MGVATLDGIPFRLDPDTVNWTFKVRKNVDYTLGGKVIQILGTEFGDMTIAGSFGRGYFQEQAAFLDRMQALAQKQVDNFTANPPRFFYPPYNWDFRVWLRGYTNRASEHAIVWKPNEMNPQWQLRLQIVEDNSGLKKVATDAFIARLAEGIGWSPGKYNGPIEWESLKLILDDVGATDATDYVIQAYNLGGGAGAAAPSSGTFSGPMTPTQIATFAYQAGFRGEALVTMVAVCMAESGGDPNAEGDTTITDATWGPSVGLGQVRSINAERGTGGTRDATMLKDPAFNLRSCWSISSQGSNFGPWTMYTNGGYQTHVPEARQGAEAAASTLGLFLPR
jgi:hypothetical protein